MTPFDLDSLRAQEPQLRRLARAIVGEAFADDVVQDAWTAALTHRGEAPDSWGAWLHRVTRNLAWKRRQRDRNEHARAVAVFDADVSDPSADDVVARVEEKHILERAILDLEEPYRSALLWRYYDGLSVAEVSERAETPASTTRTHLQRGIKRLREQLEKERGPEWRMALAPLFVPRRVAGKAAVAASGAGVAVALKVLLAVLVAAFLGAFALERLQTAPSGPSDLAALEVIRSVTEPAPVVEENRMAEPGEPLSEGRSGSAAVQPVADPVVVAAEPESTTLQLVDFESGRPLGGVTFDISFQVKKRRFFMTTYERQEHTLTTDAKGYAILAAATDSRGYIDGNPFTASVTPAPAGDESAFTRERYLQVLEVEDDGTVLVAAESSATFWVRLPDTLDAAEIAAIDGQFSHERVGYRLPFGGPLAPLKTDGRDLLFLTPRYISDSDWPDQTIATMHIATTNDGPGYLAEVRRGQCLSDEPSLAVRCDEMVQRITLVDQATGDPIKGAHLSITKAFDRRRGNGDRYSNGLTGSSGSARMIGIPHGTLFVNASCEGYEMLSTKRTFTRHESTTLKMQKKSDLRRVELTLVSEKGIAPFAVDLAAYDSKNSGPFERETFIDTRRKGKGWTATIVLEHVPARPAFVHLGFYDSVYKDRSPIRIDVNQDALTVDVGEQQTTKKLVMRLPNGVEAEYRQRLGDGREFSYHSPEVDGSTVTHIPLNDVPIHWTVVAPGYMPVKGTRDDFVEGTYGGQPCLELSPNLMPGSGTVLYAQSWSVEEGLPLHFAYGRPIAGVRFTRVETGEVLGVTDESGMVVVPGSEPLGEISASHNGTVKTHVDTGQFQRVGFTFKL